MDHRVACSLGQSKCPNNGHLFWREKHIDNPSLRFERVPPSHCWVLLTLSFIIHTVVSVFPLLLDNLSSWLRQQQEGSKEEEAGGSKRRKKQQPCMLKGGRRQEQEEP